MGLFSNLKKLRLRDIGTGKNLKKIGQGVKEMKFGEGLGLLGLGLGGAGLFGAGPLGNMLGGVGSKIGNLAFGKGIGTDAITGKVMREGTGILNNPMFKNLFKKGGKSLLNMGMKNYFTQGQSPPQMEIPQQMPQGQPQYTGQRFSSNYQENPMAVNPNIDYSQQNIGGYGGGWTG